MANKKRLIDANALGIGKAKREAFDNPAYADGWNSAIDIIENAPTVDAVEVVHAHWEDGYAVHNGKEVYKSIDCSVCHDIFKIESHDQEYWKKRFKYCPFCGAVMDEVDGNG